MSAQRSTLSPAKRGLLGHFIAVLFQPRDFFRAFPVSQQWVIYALICLGITAVLSAQPSSSALTDTLPPTDFSLPSEGSFSDPFAVPPLEGDSFANDAPESTPQITKGLLSATRTVIIWVTQAVLLGLVALFNGYAPSFGKQLQVTVWASTPFLLLIIAQALYKSAGGQPSVMGLTALLDLWADFVWLPEWGQLLIKSLLMQITLFSLWHVLLVYFGLRYALHGKRWVCGVVLFLWIAIAILTPILTGGVTVPSPQDIVL